MADGCVSGRFAVITLHLQIAAKGLAVPKPELAFLVWHGHVLRKSQSSADEVRHADGYLLGSQEAPEFQKHFQQDQNAEPV